MALTGCVTYRACEPPLTASATSQPPRTCRMDGCTLAPDLDYIDCCNKHDQLYWQGGTQQQRHEADRELRQCIAEHGHHMLASYYYLGVRVGGAPWWPTPWRWGFGWPYFHGYEQESEHADGQADE